MPLAALFEMAPFPLTLPRNRTGSSGESSKGVDNDFEESWESGRGAPMYWRPSFPINGVSTRTNDSCNVTDEPDSPLALKLVSSGFELLSVSFCLSNFEL